MPRSYSFDHFQQPKSEVRSRALKRQDQQAVAATEGGDAAAAPASKARAKKKGGVAYGRRMAQTQEFYQVRVMEKQLEELAAADEALEQKWARPVEDIGARSPAPAPTPGPEAFATPIGALPADTEPLPRTGLSDLLGEAMRQLEALRAGLTDAQQAAMRLLGLPLEAARLAAQRLRPVSI